MTININYLTGSMLFADILDKIIQSASMIPPVDNPKSLSDIKKISYCSHSQSLLDKSITHFKEDILCIFPPANGIYTLAAVSHALKWGYSEGTRQKMLHTWRKALI